jgi:hypothetical protein
MSELTLEQINEWVAFSRAYGNLRCNPILLVRVNDLLARNAITLGVTQTWTGEYVCAGCRVSGDGIANGAMADGHRTGVLSSGRGRPRIPPGPFTPNLYWNGADTIDPRNPVPGGTATAGQVNASRMAAWLATPITEVGPSGRHGSVAPDFNGLETLPRSPTPNGGGGDGVWDPPVVGVHTNRVDS